MASVPAQPPAEGSSMSRETAAHNTELIKEEIGLLANEMRALKLDERANLDRLQLELATLKRVLRELHPEFDTLYGRLAEQVRHEVSPE